MTSSDVFFLPLDLIRSSAGFSIDIGGTLAKVAYIPIGNDEGIKVPDGMGVVRLTSFPRSEPHKLVDFLLNNCKFNRKNIEEVLDVEVTGIGINLVRKELMKGLNVRLKNIPEFDLSLRAFLLIRKNDPDNAFYPTSERGSREGKEIVRQTEMFHKFMMSQMAPPGAETPEPEDDQKELTEEPKPGNDDIYPFMMVLSGSGCIMVKITGPGQHEVLDIHTRAGRYFHGLGSLLTGCKDFRELLALADKGSDRDLNFFTDDHIPEDADGNDFYSHLPKGVIGASFGKAAGKDIDEYSRADMARTLAVTTCLDIMQVVFHMSVRFDLTRIYFGGMFIESQLMRDEMTKAIIARQPELKGKHMDLRFMRYAGHLGAIGGLIPTSSAAQVKLQ